MTKFIIVRHGYSEGNKERRFSGQKDVPLDSIGRQQAELTTKYIIENFSVDSIYSSDLMRAYDTVKPLGDALEIPVYKREDLREANLGEWQGMRIADAKIKYPECFAVYAETPGLSTFPGGESYKELMVRALKAIDEIAKENDGKTVVIGTHGGVIRSLRAAWNNIPLDKIQNIKHVPNGSITVVEYNSGDIKLSLVGFDDHQANKTHELSIK